MAGRRSSFTGAWVSLLVKLVRQREPPSSLISTVNVMFRSLPREEDRSTCSYRSSSYFARANANRGIGFVDHLAHRQKTVDLALEANVRDAVSRFAEALGIDEAIVTQWIIAGGQHESRR